MSFAERKIHQLRTMSHLEKLRLLTTIIFIVCGNALLAFTIAAFIVPHNIITGGTTGIGIVIHRFFPILDISIVVLVLNTVLLIIGYFALGKKFAMTTATSSLLYPIFLGLMQKIPGIDSLTDDSLMAAIFAGCLMGVAMGMVMRVGSSTGGIDVIVLMIHHATHISLAVIVNLCDFVILGMQATFSTSEKILLGIIVLFLSSVALDKLMLLGKSQLELCIISDKYEEIRNVLLKELEAGVTMLKMESGLLRTEQKGVLCVIHQRKLYEATELVQKIDPNAFITVTQIREVRGRGFTLERDPMI